MDILFCSDLTLKEETFILGVFNLEKSGIPVTWNSIAERLEISTATARKIGNGLRDIGIIEVVLKYDNLGGAIPSELKVNEKVLKKHLSIGK